jgi:hypothetical protein
MSTNAEHLTTLADLYDSPEYVVVEPNWDEHYYDPDDTYGDMSEPDPDEWHESRLERLADMYDGWPND